MRYKLIIEYDGTAYAGWQRQQNALTVQECVEAALEELSGSKISVFGASRTDAGVHALGQTAHFDAELSIPTDRLFLAMNTHLPPDIRISSSEPAPDGFHARFSAIGKEYSYKIICGKHSPALFRNFCAFVPGELDIGLMRAAAELFIGERDFRCAMAAGSAAKSTVREVYSLTVERFRNTFEIKIRGNGFLYNMVRIIAGTLIRAGQNRLETDQIKRAIDTGDRNLLGFTAPPQGLTLAKVFYEGIIT